MKHFSVELPLSIPIRKGTDSIALNLNVYRNLHHYQNNELKQSFTDLVQPLLAHIPKLDKVHLHYVLHRPTRRRADLMNVVSIADKFFSDALVKAGVIEDDHDGIVLSVSGSTGDIDKARPRLVVQIIPVDHPLRIFSNPTQASNETAPT